LQVVKAFIGAFSAHKLNHKQGEHQMGFFDKMFGSKVSDKDHADEQRQQQFNNLRNKYQSVLAVIQQQGVQLSNLHTENGKLVIIGTAPSNDAANRVWDQIKLFSDSAQELLVDLKVSPQIQPQVQAAAATPHGGVETMRSYTVQSGDTLSKIANEFYGDAMQYMKIFNANRDKLSDPDKIQPGQKLFIP
jgi:nucleoid-associated protein YgaU